MPAYHCRTDPAAQTRIPFNRMAPVGREVDHVRQAIAGDKPEGHASFVAAGEALIGADLGAEHVLLTTSCTAALEMAVMLLDLGPGDEVIMPSFNFVSAANAVVLRGARPVFAEIDPDTFNIDPEAVEARITRRTKAILPVHYGGVGCDMARLGALAERHGVAMIEDAAQALGAAYRSAPLGSFGSLATFSFHETKNVACGNGGALVVNSPRLADRAYVLRDKGTNRRNFYKGYVDKYSWVDIGSAYALNETLAAYLLAQLEFRAKIREKRLFICDLYRYILKPSIDDGAITLQSCLQDRSPNGHILAIVTKDRESRVRLLEHLNAAGIGAVIHYVPLHSSAMGQRLGYSEGELPVTESVAARLIRLPLFYHLGEAAVQRIGNEVNRFFRVA